jgi:hypothetical protein
MPNRSFRARALSFQVGTALTFAILPHAIEAQGATATAAAASVPPATPSQLADITDRGRALAGYQRAAWRAYSQLLATKPDPRLVQRYIAYHADSGWVVAFGRLSVTRDTFYVSNVAIPAVVGGSRSDTLFDIETLTTPGADTDFLVRAARAIDTATALFWPSGRPYETAVLPAAGGSWWVYVIPAANRAGVWPLGDDMRFRVSGDGRTILEARRMHVGIIDYDRTLRPEDTRFTAGVHNTVTSEAPEDTDVYHVLTRQPRVFEYVFTPHFLYMVNEDGTIRFVLGRGTLIGTSP